MPATTFRRPFENIDAIITSEKSVGDTKVKMMQFCWTGDFEGRMQPQEYFCLDQCITPRPHGIKGCFTEHTGNHSFVPIGDLMVIPPGEILDIKAFEVCSGSQAGYQSSVICCLDKSEIERWSETELVGGQWATDALDVRNQSLRGLLWRLVREISQPGLASEASIEMICGLIAIDLTRYYAKIDFAPAKGGLASWRLRVIDEILNLEGKPPSLSEMALACNISVRQLMRGFQVSRGCSLGAYIEGGRLARAQRMLTEGAKVKTVAHTLGFASPASFCGAFKRRTGVSPGEYRARS